MAGPIPAEKKGVFEESVSSQEGFRVKFVNPELLRAYILDPQRLDSSATLAERISGIREISLGGLSLDGGLFDSAKFSLIVESNRGEKDKKTPTVIIRADFKLGDSTRLLSFQEKRAKDNLIEEDSPVAVIYIVYENDNAGSGIEQTMYSSSTIHFREALEKKLLEKNHLAVLQAWDKDMGVGSISVSLFSTEYLTNLHERYRNFSQEDVVNRWEFEQAVGIDAGDADAFKEALEFYERAFPRIVKAMYDSEEISCPGLKFEIEAPIVSEDGKTVTFDDIGGQKAAVDYLKSRGALEKREIRLNQTGGILLAGPPGTGKTSLVQAFAAELNAPLVRKTTRDLLRTANPGAILNFLEAGFYEARSLASMTGAKAIYCLEGIEAFLGSNGVVHDYFLNAIDAWSNEENIILITTSNFPEQLHPGVFSRFDKVDVLLPNRSGRKEILEIHMSKIAKMVGRDIFSEVNVDRIAESLNSFSGRDIAKFLASGYSLGRLASQEKSVELSISTEFLLSLLPGRTIGFKK